MADFIKAGKSDYYPPYGTKILCKVGKGKVVWGETVPSKMVKNLHKDCQKASGLPYVVTYEDNPVVGGLTEVAKYVTGKSGSGFDVWFHQDGELLGNGKPTKIGIGYLDKAIHIINKADFDKKPDLMSLEIRTEIKSLRELSEEYRKTHANDDIQLNTSMFTVWRVLHGDKNLYFKNRLDASEMSDNPQPLRVIELKESGKSEIRILGEHIEIAPEEIVNSLRLERKRMESVKRLMSKSGLSAEDIANIAKQVEKEEILT
jgi:hypothetical protein